MKFFLYRLGSIHCSSSPTTMGMKIMTMLNTSTTLPRSSDGRHHFHQQDDRIGIGHHRFAVGPVGQVRPLLLEEQETYGIGGEVAGKQGRCRDDGMQHRRLESPFLRIHQVERKRTTGAPPTRPKDTHTACGVPARRVLPPQWHPTSLPWQQSCPTPV